MIPDLKGRPLEMVFLKPSKEVDIEKETWYLCIKHRLFGEISPSGAGSRVKMMSMDLDMLRLQYLLGVWWCKAQGKFWTGVRDLEDISIHPVVGTVVKDEIT